MPNCTICSARSYSDRCFRHKARPPKQIKRTAIKRKPSKVAIGWERTRQVWFSLNTNPYTCHYCGILLSKKTVTLDHKIPRSRAPQLRYDLSNIVPACYSCNYLKGSVAHDEYVHNCH